MDSGERLSELERTGNEAAKRGDFSEASRVYREILQLNLTREVRVRALANFTNYAAKADLREEAILAGEEALSLHAAAPELPVLYLGVMTSLHRRDIYDDVR